MVKRGLGQAAAAWCRNAPSRAAKTTRAPAACARSPTARPIPDDAPTIEHAETSKKLDGLRFAVVRTGDDLIGDVVLGVASGPTRRAGGTYSQTQSHQDGFDDDQAARTEHAMKQP